MAEKKSTSRRSAPRRSQSRDYSTYDAPPSPRELNERYFNPGYGPRPSGVSGILVLLLVAMAFFSGYLFFKVQNLEKAGGTGQAAAGQPTDPNAAPPAPKDLKIKKPDNSDHWRGNKDARYAWVEYSDPECPFCKQAHPDIKRLVEENSDNSAWVFRHYPLSFHPKAQKSAEAVECAADQGGDEAFWNMVDAIYEKMPTLELSGLPALATEVGLDGAALKTCLDSGKHEKKVKDQLAQGTNEGVAATPTIVVYDTQTDKSITIEGALPYDQLKTQFDTFVSQN